MHSNAVPAPREMPGQENKASAPKQPEFVFSSLFLKDVLEIFKDASVGSGNFQADDLYREDDVNDILREMAELQVAENQPIDFAKIYRVIEEKYQGFISYKNDENAPFVQALKAVRNKVEKMQRCVEIQKAAQKPIQQKATYARLGTTEDQTEGLPNMGEPGLPEAHDSRSLGISAKIQESKREARRPQRVDDKTPQRLFPEFMMKKVLDIFETHSEKAGEAKERVTNQQILLNEKPTQNLLTYMRNMTIDWQGKIGSVAPSAEVKSVSAAEPHPQQVYGQLLKRLDDTRDTYSNFYSQLPEAQRKNAHHYLNALKEVKTLVKDFFEIAATSAFEATKTSVAQFNAQVAAQKKKISDLKWERAGYFARWTALACTLYVPNCCNQCGLKQSAMKDRSKDDPCIPCGVNDPLVNGERSGCNPCATIRQINTEIPEETDKLEEIYKNDANGPAQQFMR